MVDPEAARLKEEQWARLDPEVAKIREERALLRDRYVKQYYRDNKEAISRKKRERYQNDPEYREKRLASAKASKERMREERKNDTSIRIRKAKPIWFKMDVAGQEVPVLMHTTGQLAKAVGRTTQTIRIWERKGILPEAMYRSRANDRLYTAFQMAGILEAYDKSEKKFGVNAVSFRITTTNFVKDVKALWENYPLGIDEGNLDYVRSEEEEN